MLKKIPCLGKGYSLRIIKLVFVLSLFCIISFLSTGRSMASSTTAWKLFLEGDYKKSVAGASGIGGYDEHYIKGLSYLKLGKPSQARKHFLFIKDMYLDKENAEYVLASIADTFFLEGDFDRAVVEYKAFTKRYPHSDLNSLVFLRLGQTQRRLGRWMQSKPQIPDIRVRPWGWLMPRLYFTRAI